MVKGESDAFGRVGARGGEGLLDLDALSTDRLEQHGHHGIGQIFGRLPFLGQACVKTKTRRGRAMRAVLLLPLFIVQTSCLALPRALPRTSRRDVRIRPQST